MSFYDNEEVLAKLRAIKLENKKRLAAYVSRANGVNLDPESLFDVQVKRLHEYKRQLLNVLHILRLYLEIKDDPQMEVTRARLSLRPRPRPAIRWQSGSYP